MMQKNLLGVSRRRICLLLTALCWCGISSEKLMAQAPTETPSLISPATDTDTSPAEETSAKDEAESKASAELEIARQVAGELKAEYESNRELAKTGSVSQPELRQASYDFKMAALDVIQLEHPEAKQEIEIVRAKLDLELKEREFATLSKLFQRGSVSELKLRQATADRELARLVLQAAEDKDGEKLYDIRMAQSKLKLAEELKEKADRLFRSSSISATDFKQVEENLDVAKEELERAKKALGVTVKQVPPE